MTVSTPTTATARRTFSLPALLLHAEGLAAFVAIVIAYVHLQGNGWLFIALLFVPDVSMIGYLRGTQLGAWTYNAVHTYVVPGALLLLTLSAGSALGVQIALIWLAHISMDRTVGYGLKYATAFKDTHLQRV